MPREAHLLITPLVQGIAFEPVPGHTIKPDTRVDQRARWECHRVDSGLPSIASYHMQSTTSPCCQRVI